MIRVKLYGQLNSLLPPALRKRGLTLEVANGREFLSGVELHAPGFRDAMHSLPCDVFVGRSIKGARKLSPGTLAGTALVHANSKSTKDVTLHIVPNTSGAAEAVAMYVVDAFITALIAYAVNTVFNAVWGQEQDRNDTKQRRNYIFEGGMNTRREGVALPLVVGKRVRVGSNFVETAVDVQTGRGAGRSFSPGPAAIVLGFTGWGRLLLENLEEQQNQLADGFSGSKGGGGGGRTTPNTAYSEASVMALGVYSSGPTGGICGKTVEEKEQNIFIDGVRLRGLNGVRAFADPLWMERLGYPDQTSTPFTPGIPSIIQDAAPRELKATDLSNQRIYINEQVRDAKADYIKVLMGFSLVRTDNKDGDQRSAEVTFAVDVRASDAAPWSQLGRWTVNEKSSEVFQEQFYVPKPAGANGTTPWEFRVYRVTPDSSDDKITTKSVFYGWMENQNLDLNYGGDADYPACAYVTYSASLAAYGDQNNPEWTWNTEGTLMEVPSNMNTTTGEFATTGPGTLNGKWDGTYKLDTCEDPVWVLKHVATNINGAEYPDTPEDSWFDRYALYDISQFNNQKVNGEKRFTCNKQWADAEDARKVLRELALSFNAQVFETGDQLHVVQERPNQPVRRYLNNNQVVGGFAYTEAELSDQTNVMEVSYDNMEDDGKIAYVSHDDDTSIQRLKGVAPEGGRIVRRVEKVGCTFRNEAVRFAKMGVFRAQNNYRSVTFKVTTTGLAYFPGELIAIQDDTVSGEQPNSRVRSIVTPNRIELDFPRSFDAHTAYDLWAVRDNELVKIPLPRFASDTTTAVLDVANHRLTEEALVGVVNRVAAQPQVFRILNIRQQEDLYVVDGINHTEGMYEYAENGVVPTPLPWNNINDDVPVPGEMTFREILSVSDHTGARVTINVSWPMYVGTAYVRAYLLEYCGPDGEWKTAYTGPRTYAEIPDCIPGEYQFSLKHISISGRPGMARTDKYVVATGGSNAGLPGMENVLIA